MPLDYRNLQSNTAAVRIDYGEAGDINILYRPNALTEKTIRRLSVLQDSANVDFDANMSAIVGMLVQLIASWDLTANGEPVPITVEALEEVPIAIRMDVLRAILEDGRLGEQIGIASVPTLPATSAQKTQRSSGKRV